MLKVVLGHQEMLFFMGSPVLWLRALTAGGNTGLSKKLKDGSPKLRASQYVRKREKIYVIHVIMIKLSL